MKSILSIDCGTTSTRAILFDHSQNIIASSQLNLALSHPKPDWIEQDPNEIWVKTHECLNKIIDNVSESVIHAIGITNQRETAIIWNKDTGEPIGPAISWQCRRTSNICKELITHSKLIKKRTGLPLDPYFSATKFQWLLKEYPETNFLIKENKLCFGTVDTWILWKLTNGTSYATDVTNASRTMLYNIQTLSYDDTLCDLFGIPQELLPTVYHSSHNFGTYRTKNNIAIPIQGIIGDQQAALYAQCGQKNNMIKNTYGTGLFLMANTGSTIIQSDSMVSTIAIGINDTIDYAIEGSVFTGGSLVQWLRDNLGIIDSAEQSEELANSIKSSENVVIVPALSGLGAPYWKPEATGIITGLTRSTSKAHIIRAALESIAFQTNDLLNCISSECPELNFDLMRVDGGASNNHWLMKFQSDISKIIIEKPVSIEATALGAALCAAKLTNCWSDYSITADTKFSPSLADNHRQQLLSRWSETIKKYYD